MLHIHSIAAPQGPSFSNKATMPRQQVGFQLSALSRPFCILLTALLYYSLEFCNRQLLQIFPSLLSVTVALNAIVVLSATILRLLWVTQMTDKRRNFPDWSHYLKNELPVVIAWALDIVCSISYLVYIILLSLSTMTTFIRISTITVFAIVFALKQWNDIPQTLVGSVTLFTRWLLLYTFESRESNAEEFVLAVFVIGLSGLRWTIVQTLTQKHESAEQALKEIQRLEDENDIVKREKCQEERERLDLLAHKKNVEEELRDIGQRNIQIFIQKNTCLQRDLIAKEALLQELETKHDTLMVQKYWLEKEKNDWQNEKDQLVVENNNLKTVLITKESQLHELASLTTAQQEEMQQL